MRSSRGPIVTRRHILYSHPVFFACTNKLRSLTPKTKYVTELTENVYKTRIKIRAEWFAKSTVQTSDPISDATTFYFILNILL